MVCFPTDFPPVLPVVFYTGTRRWDSPGRLIDLVDLGERFESVTPAFEPLFINLPEIPAETLQTQGGYFGSVLRLVQQRQSRPREFQELLDQVVQHLETMPDAERLRWLELLSYIMALVYHARDPSEQPKLQKTIELSVRTDIHRQEIFEMCGTMADELEEKGALKNRRQVLLRLLKRRFGTVPAAVSATIRATHDPEQVDEWLDRFATAETLDDVGIGTPVSSCRRLDVVLGDPENQIRGRTVCWGTVSPNALVFQTVLGTRRTVRAN